MITVEVDKINYVVTISGHAGYSEEKGKDIVCAAVSILTYTLEDTLDKHAKYMLDYRCEDKGMVKVRCVPQEGYARDIDTVLEYFTNGIRLLHENYPNNVLLILKG